MLSARTRLGRPDPAPAGPLPGQPLVVAAATPDGGYLTVQSGGAVAVYAP